MLFRSGPDGEWTEVLSETLIDYKASQDNGPYPILSFTFDEMVNSKFVKLECTEWYGHSCALRFFNVKKEGDIDFQRVGLN